MLAAMTSCASYPIPQISHYTNIQQQRVAREIGRTLFQLPTRGLSKYTFQVPIQWQNCCQEWATL